MALQTGSLVFIGYVTAFGLAGLGCGVALLRARHIEDPGTRRGLVGLLAGSSGWALSQMGYLLAPSPAGSYVMYQVSLIVGLATIGGWLYFCSAYTGRTLHLNTGIRRLAVVVYLLIVGIKLTNPIHGLYFTTEFVTTPFPHLATSHGIVHWVITGGSYALAAVGFFMLYELFLEAEYDTRLLVAVVGVTGLPILFDLVGFFTPRIIDINYEPLGVAVFAISVLFVLKDRFLAVQLTDGVDGAVVYLDTDDQIREFNNKARKLFPALSDGLGRPLETVLPEVSARLESDDRVFERHQDGTDNYYLISESSFTLGQANVGRLVMFNDVSETERQRRELQRHNEQLEGFAAAIRHELLNTLQIVDGWVRIAGESLDSGDVQEANDALTTATEMTDRMTGIVDDLAELARYGQTTDQLSEVAFARTVRLAYERAETDELTLSIDGEGTVGADEPRLRDLFENAFEFAAHNNAAGVDVKLEDDGITITDDGEPTGERAPEDFFAYGKAVPDSAAGLTLPNLRMIARTQGWEATIDNEYDDGVRVIVSGVTVNRGEESTSAVIKAAPK